MQRTESINLTSLIAAVLITQQLTSSNRDDNKKVMLHLPPLIIPPDKGADTLGDKGSGERETSQKI